MFSGASGVLWAPQTSHPRAQSFSLPLLCHQQQALHVTRRFPVSSEPCGGCSQNTFRRISVTGNLYLATVTCHKANLQDGYNTPSASFIPLVLFSQKICRTCSFSSEKTEATASVNRRKIWKRPGTI